VPYNVNPALIELMSGAKETIQKLKNAGFKLLIISNQSGIGRGFFVESDLIIVWKRIEELCGVIFDGFYFCPHLPNDNCGCRKPNAGMLFQAAAEHQIDLSSSWFVGDALSDVEAGRRAGCQTILLDMDKKFEGTLTENQKPHFIVRNLTETSPIILQSKAFVTK
jgi:histidinol-phosphate phosphatase family protein